ncbi:MAG: DUF3419 family protein [Gammaproteobacteria bacterium]
MIQTEIENKADFSIVRYAQVWEDADILLDALNIQANDICLSIASAGDNALAMLAKSPKRVIALDLNPAQLFCLELRVAAYKVLKHSELLELLGSRTSVQRLVLYEKCRQLLSNQAQLFWDSQKKTFEKYGMGGIGKFERYFRLFKNWILPLIHSENTIKKLFFPKNMKERKLFFDKIWNSWRWRLLVRLFFSQTVMGKMGRDPAFFNYVTESFSEHISRKIEQGLCVQDLSDNPYLFWILNGRHGDALPFALREENFDNIRNNLDRLEWHLLSTDAYAAICKRDGIKINKYNLSNIFEYMSEENYKSSLSHLVEISEQGSRFVYWNMMVPRSCPISLEEKIKSHSEQAKQLQAKDKAIFYRDFIIEEIK